jgi:hypothetical protein
MKARCSNPNHNRANSYVNKGITVCDEWINDFMSFYNWALENGYKDELSIDRKDNNKGYNPDNCRWANSETQANNMTTNHLVTIENITHTIAEWSKLAGIPQGVIRERIRLGWDSRHLIIPVTPIGGDHKSREGIENLHKVREEAAAQALLWILEQEGQQ